MTYTPLPPLEGGICMENFKDLFIRGLVTKPHL